MNDNRQERTEGCRFLVPESMGGGQSLNELKNIVMQQFLENCAQDRISI